MKNNIKIFKPNKDNSLNNLFVEEGISAGFPSPAGDFEESRISLEKVVVKNKEATFYAKVSGESMKDAGLDDGDILVIDRSEELKNNKIAVCYLNGEFTVKRVKIEKDHVYLIPENKRYDFSSSVRIVPACFIKALIIKFIISLSAFIFLKSEDSSPRRLL